MSGGDSTITEEDKQTYRVIARYMGCLAETIASDLEERAETAVGDRYATVSGRAGVTLTADGFKWVSLATWEKTWKDGEAIITVRRVEDRVLVELDVPVAGVVLRDLEGEETPP